MLTIVPSQSLRSMALLAAAALFAGMVVLPAAARTPSPVALYRALLASPLSSRLPAGLHAGQPAPLAPNRDERRLHAVDQVLIRLTSAASQATLTSTVLYYVIFSTASDAQRFFTIALDHPPIGFQLQRHVPGLPNASFAVASRGKPCAGTGVWFVTANVAGIAESNLTTASKSCRLTTTVTLARIAFQHLRAVKAHSA
jgi:hypothetical protein